MEVLQEYGELGNLSRFETPRQLMGYSGLVSREHSSGGKIQRGAITKTGNAHLRRVLIEAAWAYQHRPDVTGFLLRRQKSLALADETKQMAWKAHHRLHKFPPTERLRRDPCGLVSEHSAALTSAQHRAMHVSRACALKLNSCA